MFCLSVRPESNVSHIRQFCLLYSALWFFLKTRLWVTKSNLKIFCSCPRISSSQPEKFGKSRFWGILSQWVHPEPNICHFHPFFLLDSALCFFVKSRRRVKKSNFKAIFAPSLGSLPVSWPNLLNLYSTNFRACYVNQCTQNQI